MRQAAKAVTVMAVTTRGIVIKPEGLPERIRVSLLGGCKEDGYSVRLRDEASKWGSICRQCNPRVPGEVRPDPVRGAART